MGDVGALVNYYCQAGYSRHVQTVCDQVLKKRGSDSVLSFWKAFGIAKEGHVNHAIQELNGIRNKRDVEFAVTIALLHWHEAVNLKDHEAIADLKENRSGCEERASESSIILAATFLWHIGDNRASKRLLDRILATSPQNNQALVLKGWVSISSEAKSKREIDARNAAEELFDQVLDSQTQGKKDLDAMMGKSKFFALTARYRDALELLNQAIIFYPWFLPALIEKAKILMMMGDWDQSLETSEKILQQDKQEIEALRVQMLYYVARESNTEIVLEKLDDLTEAIKRYEPDNARLYFEVAQPIARLAAHDEKILRKTIYLVEEAKTLDPENCKFVNELAYQYCLMHRFDKGMHIYEEAARLDESDGTALYGQIYCLIQQGEIEDAAQQLEFFSVVQESIGKTAELSYLSALLSWRKDEDMEKAIKQLNETIDLHVKALLTPSPSSTYDYFVRFNPDFLMEVASEYLQHCGSEPIDPSDPPSRHLLRGIKLLEKVTSQVPGLLQGQLALAHAKFVANELEESTRILNHCLKLNPSFSEAHLLLAQIHLHKHDFGSAQTSLEHALSHDFQVRDSPMYHLLRARILEAKADLDEAHTVLTEAMELPQIRSTKRANKTEARRSSFLHMNSGKPVSLYARASIYIELAKVKLALQRESEAVKLISEAMKEFKDTTEEVRIIVANSEISLKRGDIKGALRMLSAVPESSPAYTKAHMVKADVYLHHRNDKQQYARCFLELVEKNPTAHTYVLLGEAYMKINYPDEAIEAFERALQKRPSDFVLAKRIGKALVSTHDYMRAIEYYKTALGAASNKGHSELRYDLAELYYKLKKFELATNLLNRVSEEKESEGDSDVPIIQAKVKDFILLAKVRNGEDDTDGAIDALQKARNLQSAVITNVRSLNSELVPEEKSVMSNICFSLAKYYETGRNDEKAVSFYREALKYDDSSVQSLRALANLYLRRGEVDKCQQQCIALMRVDSQNEEASMMLADLMFQKHDFPVAIHHYKQLLESKPGHFVALSKVITLLRRAGRLDEAEKFLLAAEHSSPRTSHEPGFFYCRGLLSRFSNDVNGAIANFNKCRRDVTWGKLALTNMIEIYLNPDNANLWDETGVETQMQIESIQTAQQLLDEFPDTNAQEYKILSCYAMMATKDRREIETACQTLVQIANVDHNNVPALLALATALMMMKQTPKARNQLKRISELSYNVNQADAFEKCWLLLADIYIGSGKYDLAQGLCKRCLQYNKSSAKACEYMGIIMEKEASYQDAAEHYEKAWKYEKKASATIGYKLAFNYLKAHRYIEAIDIANEVISQFPDYPKIRSDVLDKARISIRP